MRQVHADFLQQYGLTAVEVPLLYYKCSQMSMGWDPQASANRPLTVSNAAECWEDIS